VIKFTDVTKDYPKTGAALKNASFHVRKGEFAFVTGHSGAGKSTALRLTYLAERPSSGDVRVSGFATHRMAPRDVPRLRRRLGIVFQDFQLLDDRTAEENVAFALEVTGARRASIGPRVMRVLPQVGLVNDPVVLLADEPTGNLDERATRGIFQLLRDINASGTAVLMATHDLDLVRSLPGAHLIELQGGAVVFDSAADEPGEGAVP
jgi:cell division transport system ATP-binding protein